MNVGGAPVISGQAPQYPPGPWQAKVEGGTRGVRGGGGAGPGDSVGDMGLRFSALGIKKPFVFRLGFQAA